MSHTKGPWEVQAPYGMNKVEITAKAGYAHIAAVMVKRPAGRDEWEPIPHGEGNARLIAAAPELLQALVTLREWVREPWGEDDSATAEAVIYQAEAAIAKAQGVAQ